MQGSKFWRSPTFSYPLIAVGLIAGAFLLYYFPYVSGRESDYDRRSLRVLNQVGAQIQNRIQLMNSVVYRASRAGLGQDYVSTQAPELRLKNCSPKVLAALDPKPLGPGQSRIDSLASDGSRLLVFRSRNKNFGCASVTFHDLIDDLLTQIPPESFDSLFLSEGSGQVYYQRSDSGLQAHDISSIFEHDAVKLQLSPASDTKSGSVEVEVKQRQSADSTASTRISSVATRMLAGHPYRTYVVPLAVADVSSHTYKGVASLVLCSAVPDGKFRRATMSVPGTVVVPLLITILLVVVASWPLLKLPNMRATERVYRVSGLLLVFATVGTVVLFLLFLSNLVCFTDTETPQQLRRLAKHIKSNLEEEVRLALNALDAVAHDPEFQRRRIQDSEAEAVPFCNPNAKGSADFRGDLLARTPLAFMDYPFADHFFWTDAAGVQRIKWSIRASTTPSTIGCEYNFFYDTLENRLWESRKIGADKRFRIDGVYSPNTGEYIAVLTRRAKPELEGRAARTAHVVTPLISLSNPVLPSDYGFAIVDAHGLVQFHSVAAKNKTEQFYSACDRGSDIRLAVLSRTEQEVSTVYAGAPHSMLITPMEELQNCPWSLIVFRDQTSRQAMHVDVMLLFCTFVLLYAAVATVAFLFYFLVIRSLPRYPQKWVWPQETLVPRYLQMAFIYVLVLLIASRWAANGTPYQSIGLALFVPAFALLTAVLKLKGRDRATCLVSLGVLFLFTCVLMWRHLFAEPARRSVGGFTEAEIMLLALTALGVLLSFPNFLNVGEEWRKRHVESSYAAAAVALVALFAVFPCIALLRVAYEYEDVLFAKRELVLTLNRLQERNERISNNYANVRFRSDANTMDQETERRVFLKHRMLDCKLDRYDMVSVDATPAQLLNGTDAMYAHPRKMHEEMQNLMSALYRLFPVLRSVPGDEPALLSRQLAYSERVGSAWRFDRDGRARVALTKHPIGEDRHDNRSADTNVALILSRYSGEPTSPVPERLIARLAGARIGVLTLLGSTGLLLLYFWLRWQLKYLFLLCKPQQGEWPVFRHGQPITEDSLLIGLPACGKTKLLASASGDRHSVRVDLAEVLQSGNKPDAQGAELIIVDHLGYRLDDSESNLKKLETIERLVHDRRDSVNGSKPPVVIVSTFDPLFHFSAGELISRTSPVDMSPVLTRWSKVLMNFRVYKLDLQPTQSLESYHRVLWSTCTQKERLALYQLAADGWLNHRNWDALVHLRHRGIVSPEPPYEIVDSGFEQFIRNEVSGQHVRNWVQLEGPSSWDGLKTALLFVGFAVMTGLLLYIQQDVLAFLTTGLTALLSVTKLISDFRTREKDTGVRA